MGDEAARRFGEEVAAAKPTYSCRGRLLRAQRQKTMTFKEGMRIQIQDDCSKPYIKWDDTILKILKIILE